MKRTEDIKQCFTAILAEVQRQIVHKSLDISVIKSHFVSYDRKLQAPLKNCISLENILDILISEKHLSFLNYDLIKILVDYGNDEVKTFFIDYKKKLQEFLKGRVIEILSGKEKKFAVVVDEKLALEVRDVEQLNNRVKFILGHKDLITVNFLDLKFENQISGDTPVAFSLNSEGGNLRASSPEYDATEPDIGAKTTSNSAANDSGVMDTSSQQDKVLSNQGVASVASLQTKPERDNSSLSSSKR